MILQKFVWSWRTPCSVDENAIEFDSGDVVEFNGTKGIVISTADYHWKASKASASIVVLFSDNRFHAISKNRLTLTEDKPKSPQELTKCCQRITKKPQRKSNK